LLIKTKKRGLSKCWAAAPANNGLISYQGRLRRLKGGFLRAADYDNKKLKR